MVANFINGEKFAQAILDGAIEGVLIVEIKSKKFRYANNSICEMLGYTHDEILHLSIDDIHPADKLPDILKIFKKQTSDKPKPANSVPCQRKNGTVFWADINTSKIIINEKDYNVGFYTDITEKINAVREVNVSQRLLSSIFDAVPDLLIVIDKSYKIQYTNFKGHDLIKQSDSEKANTCYGRFKLLDAPCEDCSAYPVFESGTIVEREMVNPADNRVREVRAFPIKDLNGKVQYVVEYVRDITEKKQAEENRLKLEQQLLQNQKLESLGVLAGGIAHDFNNLLGGIFNYIDMARTSTNEPEVSGYLNATLNTMNRVQGLTQQLLTFAKGGEPEKKTGSLNQFIQDTAEFALSGSNVSCDFSIPNDLWACDFDTNQISQVIDNLIINAKQAMPDGGKISISAQNVSITSDDHISLPSGRYVKISTKDSGQGIPQSIIPRIFEPFFTTKETGSGLGLATSYSIVKKHGGLIDVQSEISAGTVFHIYLPASFVSEDTPHHLDLDSAIGSGSILIMDDETVMRESIGKMLDFHGYKYVLAKNGREALSLFNEYDRNGSPFTAVILDLTVPGGMGGKETIDEIRKKDKSVPIIVISGYADDPIIQNPREYGFTDSIRKPFARTELIGLLSNYISLR